MATAMADKGEPGGPSSPGLAGDGGAFDQALEDSEHVMVETKQLTLEQEKLLILDSFPYKMEYGALECPTLKENPIFSKLVERVRAFYVAAEIYKKRGPTEQQLS